MFRFDFDIEHDSVHASEPPHLEPVDTDIARPEQRTCVELTLSDLVDCLPPFLSYATVRIPTRGGEETVWRRELFDARYQALASDLDSSSDDDATLGEEVTRRAESGKRRGQESTRGKEEEDLASTFDDPSDLRPGVYEGGLKTWECSLDLVSYLASSSSSRPTTEATSEAKRGSVLEVGCGSAVPTVWLFQDHVRRCLADPSSTRKRTFCLQDYNAHVLRLSTFPNLFLAYVRLVSPSSDPSGDVEVTAELKSSFLDFLTRSEVSLRFFAGDWSSFPVATLLDDDGFDLVLTSETVYSPHSLPSLLTVLESASTSSSSSMVLVASKRVYFGLGGGQREFVAQVDRRGGRCQEVWSTTADARANGGGVERVVSRCTFETAATATGENRGRVGA